MSYYLSYKRQLTNVELYSGRWIDWISYEENPVATGEDRYGAQVYRISTANTPPCRLMPGAVYLPASASPGNTGERHRCTGRLIQPDPFPLNETKSVKENEEKHS